MAWRIIGCGNIDRGDDGAGVLVARRLRELGVEAVEQTGESFSLIESWRGFEHVILVDATAAEGNPGKIRIWNAHTDRLPENAFLCSTHAFGLREAVELARAVNGLPPILLVYGIEGKQFGFGTSVSAEVARAVEAVAQEIYECRKQAARQQLSASPSKNFTLTSTTKPLRIGN